MLYTRKKRFEVYRDFFQEPEPFSDVLTPEDSPGKSPLPLLPTDYHDAAIPDQDEDGMDGFLMNSVTATVKSMSPVKIDLPLLHFTTCSSLATPLQDHTPSSIHLSQFEQPPQGTSTPAIGTYLYGLETSSRPLNYPEAVFRFCDNSLDTDASMISGEDMDSIVLSSPLTHKSRVSELKEEISSIVDRMKTSIQIHSVDCDNDTYMEGDDRMLSDSSLPDVSGLSMVCSTSTPKGIMKKSGTPLQVQKKVRINEIVDVIAPKEMKKKRPLSSHMDSNRKKMKSKSYAELMQRAKSGKDPLNLVG